MVLRHNNNTPQPFRSIHETVYGNNETSYNQPLNYVVSNYLPINLAEQVPIDDVNSYFVKQHLNDGCKPVTTGERLFLAAQVVSPSKQTLASRIQRTVQPAPIKTPQSRTNNKLPAKFNLRN